MTKQTKQTPAWSSLALLSTAQRGGKSLEGPGNKQNIEDTELGVTGALAPLLSRFSKNRSPWLPALGFQHHVFPGQFILTQNLNVYALYCNFKILFQNWWANSYRIQEPLSSVPGSKVPSPSIHHLHWLIISSLVWKVKLHGGVSRTDWNLLVGPVLFSPYDIENFWSIFIIPVYAVHAEF